MGKVNDVYFLVAKTTHETPFNLPNAAVYLAVEKKSKAHPRTSCQSFDKKLVFFTSYDCNWQQLYKDEHMRICYFFNFIYDITSFLIQNIIDRKFKYLNMMGLSYVAVNS